MAPKRKTTKPSRQVKRASERKADKQAEQTNPPPVTETPRLITPEFSLDEAQVVDLALRGKDVTDRPNLQGVAAMARMKLQQAAGPIAPVE